MIGSLRGRLLENNPPTLLVEVSGVGYEIDCPLSTCFCMPQPGAEIFIHTHMVVREDAQLLYGFANDMEKRLFRELLKINNVGPKLALAILSAFEPNQFVQCVLNHDTASLVRIPGVGKKTAERLIIEMQDRVIHWDTRNKGAASAQGQVSGHIDPRSDALSALMALGYNPQQAKRALSKLDETVVTSEEMIKYALQNMS